MKLNKLIVFSTIAIAVFFASCNFLGNDDEVELSGEAHFMSLSFARNDSSLNVNKAFFTVVREGEDSIIVNLDSLPYNTRIDSVGATFTFKSTSSALLEVFDDEKNKYDSSYLTKPDTLNFNKKIRITNFSGNGLKSESYKLKVNVHKVEPELFVWKQLTAGVFAHNASTQKALLHQNKVYYYAGTGLFNYLYVASTSNLQAWTQTPLNGLPVGCDFSDMVVFDNKFYLLHDNNSLYTSTDGNTWQLVSEIAALGFKVHQLLYVFENKLWAITQNTNSTVFNIRSYDGKVSNVWSSALQNIDETFPLNDFASLTFNSPTNKRKALVVGGTRGGEVLRNVWSTENGSYWVDFSLQNKSLSPIFGSSMLYYSDRILMFGGINSDATVRSQNILESIDEGFTWRTPDTTFNQIREIKDGEFMHYAPRFGQSALLLNDDKEILIIGGYDNQNTYSDVWKGYVNKINFVEK